MSTLTTLRKIIYIISIMLVLPAAAQHENVWVFGQGAGLDFNSGNPAPIQTNITGFGEASASVCDENGQLLFYTNGNDVWDRTGQIMPNGNNLIELNSNNSVDPTSSTSQGAIIIPFPKHPSKYFIFSLTSDEHQELAGRLYYSIVEMNLNNGSGDVLSAEKGVFVDSGFTEAMTAIVGDRCNVWLITALRAKAPTALKVFEITNNGLNPISQTWPAGTSNHRGIGGGLTASPDRKKLAFGNNGPEGLMLYDFDAGSGMISNPLPLLPFSRCYGVIFSPDNSKLYANPQVETAIYQFDISSNSHTDILNSKTVIGQANPLIYNATRFKTGSNGKIYFAMDKQILGVINYPNLSGSACGFKDNALTLLRGTNMSIGLPNVVPITIYDTFLTSQKVTASCFATPLRINANNDSTGWDYVWDNGSTADHILIDTPGTYYVTYGSSPCNYHVDTFHVSFPYGHAAIPEINSTAACRNDKNGRAWAKTSPGDTLTYNYYWLNSNKDTLSRSDTLNNVESGNYTLYISTSTGCDTTLSLHIPQVDYETSFTVKPIACVGEVLSFQNTSDTELTTFIWNFGDTNQSHAFEPEHTYNQAGTYTVQLIGQEDVCMDTFYREIVIDPAYTAQFSTDKDSICVGEKISFSIDMDRLTVTDMHWQMGDGKHFSTNEITFNHAYDRSGKFPVTLTAQFRACPDTAFTDTVYVFDLPEVYLGQDTALCLNGTPITLKNHHQSAPTYQSYLWNTGDTSPTLKVVQPGRYTLHVSSAPLGCTTTEEINISKDCYIDIPNAFTPNGDGENDYFFPRQLLSQGISQFKMRVYNRWGQVVYETNRTDGRGWDGRFNNQDQPQGVYIYDIEVEIKGLNIERYHGNVTLIR